MEAALKRAFRPEFLNRIDETIVFHPLGQEQIVEIVGLMAREVRQRLEEQGITFELTREAGLRLAREGFDPVYGARPLRRAIQRSLENPLARLVLSGELAAGSHVVGGRRAGGDYAYGGGAAGGGGDVAGGLAGLLAVSVR